MLSLVTAFILHTSPPRIASSDAILRVKRVLEILRERGDGQGVPAEYFEYLKFPIPPKLDDGPSGAMMGRRWEVYGETGSGYSVGAYVDASDGIVRSFSWYIPSYGTRIAPVKKRPADEWLLARAREYAQGMGVTASLKLDRVEPNGNSGSEACWDVWLTQTFQGIPIGEGYVVVDGRYGLLTHGDFWPTPNPPRSIKPHISSEKAKTLALEWVKAITVKRQEGDAPPFDPSRMSLILAPTLRIVRSPESQKMIDTSPFEEHAADRLPGMLVYSMDVGVDRVYSSAHQQYFFQHRYTIQIDAADGRVVSSFDLTPAMMG